jgi:hypothetical protein
MLALDRNLQNVYTSNFPTNGEIKHQTPEIF